VGGEWSDVAQDEAAAGPATPVDIRCDAFDPPKVEELKSMTVRTRVQQPRHRSTVLQDCGRAACTSGSHCNRHWLLTPKAAAGLGRTTRLHGNTRNSPQQLKPRQHPRTSFIALSVASESHAPTNICFTTFLQGRDRRRHQLKRKGQRAVKRHNQCRCHQPPDQKKIVPNMPIAWLQPSDRKAPVVHLSLTFQLST
jgi:hypothetical protein